MPFEMDAWGVDVAMAGSQKGLMTPPGLGFVAAGSAPARRTRRPTCARPIGTGPFREGEVHYQKYCGTPPEHLLFGLRAALDMIFAEGLETCSAAIACSRKRRAARSASGPRARRSASTSPSPAERCRHGDRRASRATGASAQPLVDYCREKCGVVLGRGLGELRGQGLSHRPYGPRQRADGARHAQRRRDGRSRRSAFRTARAACRRRSNGSARKSKPEPANRPQPGGNATTARGIFPAPVLIYNRRARRLRYIPAGNLARVRTDSGTDTSGVTLTFASPV